MQFLAVFDFPAESVGKCLVGRHVVENGGRGPRSDHPRDRFATLGHVREENQVQRIRSFSHADMMSLRAPREALVSRLR